MPQLLVDSIPKYYNSTSYLRKYKSLRQYQKQQGKITAFLRPYTLGTHDPQRKENRIDRQQHPFVDRHFSENVDDTPNPSTDSCALPMIDTSVRTSIDIRPQDMVATLILERDENGDLQDKEDHLSNAASQRLDDQRAVIPDQDEDIAAAAHVVDDDLQHRTLADYNRPDQYDKAWI
ncbi:hypothetical protein F2Q70_00011287 [Brassica cretica]|uniref:Uncharacterized protein n=1 Tax=Brassica cretica TaxID=69181 RepID=A0A8S9M2A9_BRACR|nr:hypothetical protein F2Q70_00011287 [Brassica cretica]KAF3544358.1 hypothetical protein DY000_02006449 [Brassica cretica]